MTAPALQTYVQGQSVCSADNLNTFQQTCDTFGNMRALVGVVGMQIFTRGGTAIDDGYQGNFYWNAASVAAASNDVVVPNGAGSTGRWVRIGDIPFAELILPTGAGLIGFSQILTYPQGTVGLSLQREIVVNDAPFNAVGDGVTDNYNAITAAVTYINSLGGGKLVFRKGIYFINHFKQAGPSPNGIDNFTFSNCNGLVIEGNGSTVQMLGGWTMNADHGSASWKTNLGFWFEDCTNVKINNLTQNGGAATIIKGAGLTAENTSYGFRFDGCKGVNLNNVHAEYNCTDGFIQFESNVTAVVNTDFTLVGCRFNNNARQGMTINQLRRATFTGCVFTGTGNTGTFGAFSPAGGVDIEPNRAPPAVSDYTGDITFVGCSFYDNQGADFVSSNVALVPDPVRFHGCNFGDATSTSTTKSVRPGSKLTQFFGCAFQEENLSPDFGGTGAENARTEVHGCSFQSSDPDQRSILFGPGASSVASLFVSGCTFLFNSPTPRTAIRLFIEGGMATDFIDNTIFIAGTEYAGGTGRDVALLVRYCIKATGNKWNTDLATAGNFFVVAYDNTLIADDYYQTPDHISPAITAYPTPFFTRRPLQSLGSYIAVDLPDPSVVGDNTRAFVIDSTVAAATHFGVAVVGGSTHGVPVIVADGAWVIG